MKSPRSGQPGGVPSTNQSVVHDAFCPLEMEWASHRGSWSPHVSFETFPGRHREASSVSEQFSLQILCHGVGTVSPGFSFQFSCCNSLS